MTYGTIGIFSSPLECLDTYLLGLLRSSRFFYGGSTCRILVHWTLKSRSCIFFCVRHLFVFFCFFSMKTVAMLLAFPLATAWIPLRAPCRTFARCLSVSWCKMLKDQISIKPRFTSMAPSVRWWKRFPWQVWLKTNWKRWLASRLLTEAVYPAGLSLALTFL